MNRQKYLSLDAKASVKRMITSFIEDMKKENLSLDLQYFDLDAHADASEVPETDIIALQGFSGIFEEKFIDISFNVGVSTFNDSENTRHDAIMSHLVGRLYPMETIELVTYDEGIPYGSLIVRGSTDVSPFAKTNIRPIQFCLVETKSTETIKL